MTHRIGSMTIPDRGSLTASLALRVPDRLRDAVALAETRLRDAVAARDAAGRRVVELREALSRGAATPEALEQALLRLQATAAAIAPCEQALAAERVRFDAGLVQARRTLIDQAARERDSLQKFAERITPFLEDVRALERELDAVVARAGDPNGVKAITWPSCLQADADGMRAQQFAVAQQRAR